MASCSFVSFKAATESGCPVKSAASARSFIVNSSTGAAVTLFA
jgi:hypothetical protein